jgi:methionyl-tRNA formyltransferase
MKTPISLLFFGSTTDSVIVLNALTKFTHPEFEINIAAVVTKTPSPVGRDKIITTTPVEDWGREHNISVLSFASDPKSPWKYQDENSVIESLSTFQAGLCVSASYGQMIPWKTISCATYKGLNVHPSLLPRWRGADPLPWTILAGDHQTGVTVVTLSEKFDEGKLIAQKKVPVEDSDLPDPLRTKLFTLGSELLVESIPGYITGDVQGDVQKPEVVTTARRLKRDDGFIPYSLIQKALAGEEIEQTELPPFLQSFATKYAMPLSPWAFVVDRMIRALSPWPGVWTEVTVNGEKKRLKILSGHSEHHSEKDNLVIETVQLEGKQPVSFSQFSSAYNR